MATSTEPNWKWAIIEGVRARLNEPGGSCNAETLRADLAVTSSEEPAFEAALDSLDSEGVIHVLRKRVGREVSWGFFGDPEGAHHETEPPYPDVLAEIERFERFWEHARGPEQRDLMRALGISKAAVRHRLQVLMDMRLVERAEDATSWGFYRLTPLGTALAPAAAPHQETPAGTLDAEARSHAVEAFEQYCEVIGVLIERLRRAADASAAEQARLLLAAAETDRQRVLGILSGKSESDG